MKHDNDEISAGMELMPIGAAVVWIGCMGIGITGILMPSIPPAASPKATLPTEVTLIQGELSRDTSPLQKAMPPPAPQQDMAPPAPALIAPVAPPMIALAAPTASLAFALPTSGPVSTAPPAEAIPAHDQAKSVTAPTVQRISYGQGEGRQPKPEYPPEAQVARQYGKVLVRFTIAEDGHVNSAQAIEPCPYPLLNQSAVRTIREEWRFEPGPARVKEIVIEFDPKHS
jgi:TonB family protein